MDDVKVGDRVRIGWGDPMIHPIHHGNVATVIEHTPRPTIARVRVWSRYFPFVLEVWVTKALLQPDDAGERV
jgi:hypothetical protein